MLVPFQFKDLGAIAPLPSSTGPTGTFEPMVVKKPQEIPWQPATYRNLQGDDFQPIESLEKRVDDAKEELAGSPDTDGFEIQAPPPLISREQLDDIQETARKTGHDGGYKAGKLEGHEAGFAIGKAALDKEIEGVKALAQNLLSIESTFYTHIQKDLIHLLQQVPTKIIQRELSLKPETIEIMAETLLSQFASQRQLTLKANPEDLKILKESGVLELEDGRLTLIPDPGAKRADLHLITESGEIDATIDTQLARYYKQVETWITGSHDHEEQNKKGAL